MEKEIGTEPKLLSILVIVNIWNALIRRWGMVEGKGTHAG